MLLLTVYTIIGFGTFLAALFEREDKFWSLVAGIFWPLILYRIVRVRYFGD